MKRYFERVEIGDWRLGFESSTLQSLIATLLFLIIPLLYLATLAQSPVLGDPTEYTFVAHVLGIAHPPGYAFITLVGNLLQTIVPVGTVAWRMHLLAAVSGTAAALFVYGTVKTVIRHQLSVSVLPAPRFNLQSLIIPLFAALTVGTAVNVWQHAIHANPHIITATFTVANVYFLTKWGVAGQAFLEQSRRRSGGAGEQGNPANKWLYAFALSAGLGVAHHPLTVFGFPAYGLFILFVWWRRVRLESGEWRLENGNRPARLQSLISTLRFLVQNNWRTFFKMLALALLGLTLFLYYPLRSPDVPFGPVGMNTLDGFLDHVLARGISESLPYYSLADQPARALVFWSILRLQYSLPVVFLAVWGVVWPFLQRVGEWGSGRAGEKKRSRSLVTKHLVVLYLVVFLSFYAFVISLRAQDIMAYILGPLMIVGLLAGIGLYGLLALLQGWLTRRDGARDVAREVWLLAAALFLLGPGLQIARNGPRVSLRQYSEGADYVTAVFGRFTGQGEGATLLNDWEHMTPLWYGQFVQNRWPDPADLEPVLVSTARPWLESVFTYLPGGPVYLSNYRREIVDAGFRLRPRGPFYQVVEPGEASVPPELTPASAVGEAIAVVGYGLPQTAVSAGDIVPLTLAMTTPVTPTHYYVPVVRVGEIEYTFTTDSHLLTPLWQPGEVIVERFDVALPYDLGNGRYPVTVDLKNLSTDTVVPLDLSLGELEVAARPIPPRTDHLLANFRQRVGLVSARAGGRTAPWTEPISARPGDMLPVILRWQALAKAEESYTVFVHLIDAANRPLVALDYTPLGGAMPTHLWFPKWLPGQQMWDPYRLTIPADLPPGTYFIEVGLYEMVSGRRLHIAAQDGDWAGDRYILGPVVVE